MSKLDDRKANYQAAVDKNTKIIQQCQTTIQQLSAQTEQLRGAIQVCDELIKEQGPDTDHNEASSAPVEQEQS